MKIVKNPDGSMQRAAMTASALAKERRELKEQQQRTLLEAIPKDLSRHAAAAACLVVTAAVCVNSIPTAWASNVTVWSDCFALRHIAG